MKKFSKFLIILFFISFLIFLFYNESKKKRNFVKELKGYSVVFVEKNDCKYCIDQKNIVNKIINKSELKNIKFIDIANNKSLKKILNIEYVPTILLLKDGEEEERIVGLQTEKKLKEILSKKGIK